MENLSPEAVKAMNAIADAFAPKKDKKAKKQFVMIVDGEVLPDIIPTKKDVKAAAAAITLNMVSNGLTAPSIRYAQVTDSIEIKVPTEIVADKED